MYSPLPDRGHLAVKAWNLMGGLNWQALPIVCDMLGVKDPEALINQLAIIRDYYGNRNRA